MNCINSQINSNETNVENYLQGVTFGEINLEMTLEELCDILGPYTSVEEDLEISGAKLYKWVNDTEHFNVAYCKDGELISIERGLIGKVFDEFHDESEFEGQGVAIVRGTQFELGVPLSTYTDVLYCKLDLYEWETKLDDMVSPGQTVEIELSLSKPKDEDRYTKDVFTFFVLNNTSNDIAAEDCTITKIRIPRYRMSTITQKTIALKHLTHARPSVSSCGVAQMTDALGEPTSIEEPNKTQRDIVYSWDFEWYTLSTSYQYDPYENKASDRYGPNEFIFVLKDYTQNQ